MSRDWRRLVMNVLADLNGLEFTKDEFLKRCSGAAWSKYGSYRRLLTPSEELERKQHRFPYIAEKVIPWLLCPTGLSSGRRSRLREVEVLSSEWMRLVYRSAGVPAAEHIRWEVGWSGPNNRDDTFRVVRVRHPYPETAHSPLDMKVIVVTMTAVENEYSVALARGNWQLVGDFLQDREIDAVVGARLAADPEASLLYAIGLVMAAAPTGEFPNSVWGSRVIAVEDMVGLPRWWCRW